MAQCHQAQLVTCIEGSELLRVTLRSYRPFPGLVLGSKRRNTSWRISRKTSEWPGVVFERTTWLPSTNWQPSSVRPPPLAAVVSAVPRVWPSARAPWDREHAGGIRLSTNFRNLTGVLLDTKFNNIETFLRALSGCCPNSELPPLPGGGRAQLSQLASKMIFYSSKRRACLKKMNFLKSNLAIWKTSQEGASWTHEFPGANQRNFWAFSARRTLAEESNRIRSATLPSHEFTQFRSMMYTTWIIRVVHWWNKNMVIPCQRHSNNVWYRIFQWHKGILYPPTSFRNQSSWIPTKVGTGRWRWK